MSDRNPDPKIRLLVATWPDDAPRGAVAAFCRKHTVSTSWFYKIRAITKAEGAWVAIEAGSTRPHSSPTSIPPELVEIALETRAGLKKAGFDYGPISVEAKLRRLGLPSPSRASLARIFTRAGVVIPEPRKRPRSALRRFVYPAPNCCWQIDATEWTLRNGRAVVIFQLIDDHSRLALASLAASGETSEAAIRVVKTAISRHGVPQRFLSDNGAALNPSRQGHIGALVSFLESLGVQPITGKPFKPTTQGKNERFHQTLQKYLNAHPVAETLEELQSQVDAFDLYYNTEREHQALAPRTTPQEAWDATETAPPPTPPQFHVATDTGVTERVVNIRGIVSVLGADFYLGTKHRGRRLYVTHTEDTVSFFDEIGTEIISHPKPSTRTRYVSKPPRKG